MYYETKTLLLGATDKICDFSIEDYILEKIYIKDIDYENDLFFSFYGERYIKELYPFYQNIASGKYYILLTHTSYGEKDINDIIYYGNNEAFEAKPYAYKQGCINVIKFIKKIQLIAGVNVFSSHIMTLKADGEQSYDLEINYPFQFPSYRVLRETFQFPASKLNYNNFISEIDLLLPQKQDKGTLAFEFFIDSLYQQDIKTEYIMLILALESLLGDENTKYNSLAKNYGKFMANDDESKANLEKEIRLLYWTRNQLMHKGTWNKDFGNTNTHNLREYVRLALLKYIEEIYDSIEHQDFIKLIK